MNIRKNIDYSEMYATLDRIMTAVMPQMELYCEIGKAVCMRTEKGAAVAAAEYLSKQYPDVQGFSPRNLRRMRDLYRTYEDHPALLASAMQVGWTQNVVIMEADLSMELREWYLKATSQFGWTKAELNEKIAENTHEQIKLATGYCVVEYNREDARDEIKRTRTICGTWRLAPSFGQWRRFTKKEERRCFWPPCIFRKVTVPLIRCRYA